LDEVLDPTGAGDTFAGGFLGYLAQKDSINPASLRQAVIHGSVVASFACQDFGPASLVSLTNEAIAERYKRFQALVRF
jgi:sugar/nucleoside kinase (ribokinase family)